MTRTVLLDTNVWSYIADEGAADDLALLGLDFDLDFLVATTTVLEQLRLSQRAVRRRLLQVTTDSRWKRLMPEDFLACAEIIRAVRRHRPEWIVERPAGTALRAFRENEHDWRHSFWCESRLDPDRRHARTVADDEASRALAVAGLTDGRRVTRSQDANLDDISLCGAMFEGTAQFGETNLRVSARQASSALHTRDALFGSLADTTYHDWLGAVP